MARSRLRPPDWLKQRLLPAWNATIHGSRHALELLSALASGRLERCQCCGQRALMVYRSRVVSTRLATLWGLSPRLARALARKESLDCSRCGAKLRGRRLAATILELYPTSPPGASLANWATRPESQSIRIAEINTIDGVHESLKAHSQFHPSDFQPDVSRKPYATDVRHEDVQRLSYMDDSFDLVLTSETLEHVPDLDAALAEIRRVLVPGGRHVFTVPVLPGVEQTFARSILDPDGSVQHLFPPLCHPGGDVGYPVFHEFGLDFPAIVRAAGFEVEVRYGPVSEDDLGQVYVARRPNDPESGV